MQAKTPRIAGTCAVCGDEYDATASAVKHGRRTCSRACSYRLRMQTRANPGEKLRKSDEHKRARKLAKERAYRERHRAARNRKQAAYIKAHPEIAYAARERRRAREAGATVNDLTRNQWRAIREAFGHRCAYCGEHFERLTMDHVIPLSKGGSHTAENVVPACRSCNCRKATSLIAPRFLPENPGYLLDI